MALPHEHITQIPNNNPDAVPSLWNERYDEIDENFADHETRVAATAAALAAAAGGSSSLAARLEDIEAIAGELGNVSAETVQRAVSLDWIYRDNRIVFELWKTGFTLIDTIDTNLVSGIMGDDSVDVGDTSQLNVGGYYVIEDTNGKLLVKCASILSSSRIRIDQNLPYTLGSGVLTRCTMDYVDRGYADCAVGDIWLSKVIDLGGDEEGSAVIIRRSLNESACRLYYMDENYTTSWTESTWALRRQGGDIPIGYADYEYIVPIRGNAHLMLVIEAQTVTLRHIVGVQSATGLGGYQNPDMKPDSPTISAPSNGATGVSDRPTLAIASYSSPNNTPQAGIQFQIATASDFASVLHDSGPLPAGLSYTIPASILSANTTYYVRARVVDAAEMWSDWSAVTSFTTMASIVYISAPSIVSPGADAVDVGEQPTLQTGAFTVVGGTDTHEASQWQIRTSAGSWTSPLWDSGEDITHKLSVAVPSGYLQAGQQYYVRARHKGTSHGWSEYSTEVHFTTAQSFTNVVGVCCTATGGGGGTWVYVDGNGNTIVPGSGHFNSHPIWGNITEVTIDGQAMIEIPKFYVKRGLISGGANNGKEAWWISDQAISGFSIHPAFRNGGADIDQIYVGKYQASSDGAKLKSVSGVLPVVQKRAATLKSEADARNVSGVTGFMVWSVFQWAAIQWLYLVENATMNSQAKTGVGRVTAQSAANVDASDVAQAIYRGIVGLWGNVSQYVDGLKTDGDRHINLWDRDGNEGWIDTGAVRSGGFVALYPTTFMSASGSGFNFADIFIGDTGPTNGETTSTAPDEQWFSDPSSVPYVGGRWDRGTDAGLWYIDCEDPDADRPGVGTRLAKL